MAKLYFVYSVMSGSKSATLLMKSHNLEEHGFNVALIKPSIDTRWKEDEIVSRIGISKSCYTVSNTDSICDVIYENYDEADYRDKFWILVDEAQFLTEEQVNELAYLVDGFNINVICYGLRTDFQSKLFEGSRRLFEIADSIEELKVACSCGNKAIINARIDSNGNLVTEGDQVEIGGDDRYVVMCRKCYKKLRN